MKQQLISGILATVCVLSVAAAAAAQEVTIDPELTPITPIPRNTLVKVVKGTILIPSSSVPPAKNGTTLKTMQMSTNLEIYWPAGWKPSEVAPPKVGNEQPFPGYYYETPASIACDYGLVAVAAGCNPSSFDTVVIGGTKAIAIVDAYDDPWAGPDLAYFSDQFGLPFSTSQLQVVYEDGPGLPPLIDTSGSWELEESLDIEYAHAMAPGATIYLVEVDSTFLSDLTAGVTIASNLIQCGLAFPNPTTTGKCSPGSTGTGEVSMSWGGAEFTTTTSGPGETSLDSYFTTPGVVYVASSGDGPGTIYPCVSPNVVCAGGTTLRRNPATGALIGETTWDSGGGGESLYEPNPSYQSSVPSIVAAKHRGVPDISSDANPITGVWVWDSNYFEADGGGWFVVGGTSVSSPTIAGILNKAASSTGGTFAASSAAELLKIYTNRTVTAAYTNTTTGNCGPYSGWTPVGITGNWNPCTGVGTPKGYTDK